MRYIDQNEQTQWHRLANHAKAIESMLSDLTLATLQADIPDKAKIAVQDWISRADTFKGLSYFCTPQSEWQGGENFKVREPHICNATVNP
jgi:hypothetical protein